MLSVLMALSTSAHAWDSELLNSVPPGFQGYLTNPKYVDLLCNYTNRLVIARITDLERTETLLPPEDQRRGFFQLATLEVLRQVEGVGPAVSEFRMLMPGGPQPDGSYAGRVGYAIPKIGKIVAIPAIYPRNDFSDPLGRVVSPQIIEIPEHAELPSNAEITAAYREVCSGGR